MKNLKLTSLNKQNGSVLIISLLMLVVLTIIGVSSMSSSGLQEKMAGNFRDREVAFQAAEMALAAAEDHIAQNIQTENLPNANGFYTAGNGPTSNSAFTTSWWSGSNSQVLATTIDKVRSQPRFIVEYRRAIGVKEGTSINLGGYGESSGGGSISNFRVTVQATGLSDNTKVILQSNYGKRL